MIIKSFVEDYTQFNLKEIEPNNEIIFDVLFSGFRESASQIHKKQEITEIGQKKESKEDEDFDIDSILSFHFNNNDFEDNFFDTNITLEPIRGKIHDNFNIYSPSNKKNSIAKIEEIDEYDSMGNLKKPQKKKKRQSVFENEKDFFDPGELWNLDAHSTVDTTEEGASLKDSIFNEKLFEIPSHLSDDEEEDEEDEEPQNFKYEEDIFFKNSEEPVLNSINFNNFSFQNFLPTNQPFPSLNPYENILGTSANDDNSLSTSAKSYSLTPNSYSNPLKENSILSRSAKNSLDKSGNFIFFETPPQTNSLSRSLNEDIDKHLTNTSKSNESISISQPSNLNVSKEFSVSGELSQNSVNLSTSDALNKSNTTKEITSESEDTANESEVKFGNTTIFSQNNSLDVSTDSTQTNANPENPQQEVKKISSKKKIKLESIERNFTLNTEKTILEIVEYLADNGDVQTCTFIAYILRDYIQFDQKKTLQWAFSYIDLLQKHSLYNCSNEVINIWPDQRISSMNSKETHVHVSCGHCNQPIFDKNSVCLICKKYTCECSICRAPVKGLIAWCKGCGHGGHLKEMRDWLRENKRCPVPTCKHQCLKY